MLPVDVEAIRQVEQTVETALILCGSAQEQIPKGTISPAINRCPPVAAGADHTQATDYVHTALTGMGCI